MVRIQDKTAIIRTVTWAFASMQWWTGTLSIKVKEKVNHLRKSKSRGINSPLKNKSKKRIPCIPRQTCLISTLWMLKSEISALVFNVQTSGRQWREDRWVVVWLRKANLWLYKNSSRSPAVHLKQQVVQYMSVARAESNGRVMTLCVTLGSGGEVGGIVRCFLQMFQGAQREKKRILYFFFFV